MHPRHSRTSLARSSTSSYSCTAWLAGWLPACLVVFQVWESMGSDGCGSIPARGRTRAEGVEPLQSTPQCTLLGMSGCKLRLLAAAASRRVRKCATVDVVETPAPPSTPRTPRTLRTPRRPMSCGRRGLSGTPVNCASRAQQLADQSVSSDLRHVKSRAAAD